MIHCVLIISIVLNQLMAVTDVFAGNSSTTALKVDVSGHQVQTAVQ